MKTRDVKPRESTTTRPTTRASERLMVLPRLVRVAGGLLPIFTARTLRLMYSQITRAQYTEGTRLRMPQSLRIVQMFLERRRADSRRRGPNASTPVSVTGPQALLGRKHTPCLVGKK